jgi:hypothetical protein
VVALLMISLTVVLSLEALAQARRTAALALETRQAGALITELFLIAPDSFATLTGEREGLAYRVETTLTGADRPIEVCRRAVRVTRTATGRTYQAATLTICPVEAAA